MCIHTTWMKIIGGGGHLSGGKKKKATSMLKKNRPEFSQDRTVVDAAIYGNTNPFWSLTSSGGFLLPRSRCSS